MVANLILEAAGTAGMLAAEVTKKPDAANQEKKRTMIQSAIYGPKRMISLLNTITGKAGILGINFSVSSAVRQGQAWTAMVSTLFQLAGAFLDMAFAPLIPSIARVLKGMAGTLPLYADFIEEVSYKIQKTFAVYKEKFTGEPYKLTAKIASVGLTVIGRTLTAMSDRLWKWWKDIGDQKGGRAKQVLLYPFMGGLAFALGIAGEGFSFTAPFVDPEATGVRRWVQTAVVGTVKTGWSNIEDVSAFISSLVTGIKQDPVLNKLVDLLQAVPAVPIPSWMELPSDNPWELFLMVTAPFVRQGWSNFSEVVEAIWNAGEYILDLEETISNFSKQKLGNTLQFVND